RARVRGARVRSRRARRAVRRPPRADGAIEGAAMIGRWARTVLRLHPLQIALRPPRAVAARVIRGVPAAGGPRVRRSFAPAHEATRAFARAERARGEERLAHLTGRLRDYEAVYGLEAGDA